MKTISCPACNTVNSADTEACSQCDTSLAEAKFQQSIDEINQLTERLRELNAPSRSFNSFNGCGTMLLDYRVLSDGTYEAMRWVTIFYLPIVPLSAFVIEPTGQDIKYGQQTSRFSIIDQRPVSIARVLRTYALVVVGLAPVILGFLNSRAINHTLGGPWAFVAMLATIAWGIYILFFKLKNDSKGYKAKSAAQKSNAA
jgi:hypothetical protein